MTPEKPTLTAARQALVRYKWHGEWEHVDTAELRDEDFVAIEEFLGAAIARMCQVLGHEWEHDHCGIPSHQYCIYCEAHITARALEAQASEEDQ